MINKNFALFVFLLSNVSYTLIANTVNAADSKSIYLIRHAEKQVDGTSNPSLTSQGQQRATKIIHQLKDRSITKIYSTNYKRTLETVKPLAQHLNLEVTLYDPRKLKLFAKELISAQGNILVVGHSNTTPSLVVHLGGNRIEPMDESEFGRMYQLIISGGQVKTLRHQSK